MKTRCCENQEQHIYLALLGFSLKPVGPKDAHFRIQIQIHVCTCKYRETNAKNRNKRAQKKKKKA